MEDNKGNKIKIEADWEGINTDIYSTIDMRKVRYIIENKQYTTKDIGSLVNISQPSISYYRNNKKVDLNNMSLVIALKFNTYYDLKFQQNQENTEKIEVETVDDLNELGNKELIYIRYLYDILSNPREYSGPKITKNTGVNRNVISKYRRKSGEKSKLSNMKVSIAKKLQTIYSAT